MPIRKEVQQGDSVVKLATAAGFLPATVWNHPENAALKKRRAHMNVLMPGDVLYIPDREPKDSDAATDQLHTFVRKGVVALFRLQVFDVEEPRANQEYRLTLDGRQYEGTTDKAGVLEHFVPPGSERGELIIGPDNARIEILVGHLDPIDEITGLQKRLANLGYVDVVADGTMGPQTRTALAAFQRRFGLAETGEPDADTLEKLRAMHDDISEFPPEPESAAPAGGPNGESLRPAS
jgi:N-acetylmuramoyl-L-alanine amidase